MGFSGFVCVKAACLKFSLALLWLLMSWAEPRPWSSLIILIH